MNDLAERADHYLKLSLEEYKELGGVPAKLIVSTERGIELVCILARVAHPGDLGGEVLARLASLLDVTCAVLITEAWMKQYRLDEADPAIMERGHLEQLHDAGDTSVTTSITITVTDGVHREHRFADAVTGEVIGEGDNLSGYLTEVMDMALAHGKKVRKDADPTVFLTLRALSGPEVAIVVGAALGQTGLIEEMILGAEFIPPSPEHN